MNAFWYIVGAARTAVSAIITTISRRRDLALSFVAANCCGIFINVSRTSVPVKEVLFLFALGCVGFVFAWYATKKDSKWNAATAVAALLFLPGSVTGFAGAGGEALFLLSAVIALGAPIPFSAKVLLSGKL